MGFFPQEHFPKGVSKEEKKKIHKIAKQPFGYSTDNAPEDNVILDLAETSLNNENKNQEIRDYMEEVGNDADKALPYIEKQLKEYEDELKKIQADEEKLEKLKVLGENIQQRSKRISERSYTPHRSTTTMMDTDEVLQILEHKLEALTPRYAELEQKLKAITPQHQTDLEQKIKQLRSRVLYLRSLTSWGGGVEVDPRDN